MSGGASSESTGPPSDTPSEDGSESGDAGLDGSSSSGDEAETGSGCGNGLVDMGEQCDGIDLDFTCELLGYGGGELLCDPVTCTYDTSSCIPDMGGTTG